MRQADSSPSTSASGQAGSAKRSPARNQAARAARTAKSGEPRAGSGDDRGGDRRGEEARRQAGDDRRTYVLDTSVLLADPGAIGRFAEHRVVLPLVVISELEAKRHHPELGWFARQTLRSLDDLRIKHGRLDAPIPIGNEGGTLNVELNHADLTHLPAGFRVE